MRINACVKVTKPTLHSKRMLCDLYPLVMDEGISGLKIPRLVILFERQKFSAAGYYEFNQSFS